MDDLTEDRLRADLARCATYAAPSAPPVDALIRSANGAARHGRTRWVAAGAAAAVAAVAVVAAVVSSQGGTSPDPAPPVVTTPSTPPAGAPLPRVPYAETFEGILHLDGREMPVTGYLLATAGGTVITEESESRAGSVIAIYRGTARDEIGVGIDPKTQGVSPAGRYVWVAEQKASAAKVTVWDAEARQPVGTREIPGSFTGPTGGGGDLEIVGVDDDGRIFWETLGPEGRTLFMAPGPEAEAQQVRGLGDDWWPATLTTAGLQVRGSFLSSRFGNETGTPYVTARLGPGATWGECDDTADCIIRSGRTPAQASYSPDGSHAVFRDQTIRAVGRARDNAGFNPPVDLDLPDGATQNSLRFVGWEDDDTFLLVQGTPLEAERVLRCEAADGDCAVVLEASDHPYEFAEDPLIP